MCVYVCVLTHVYMCVFVCTCMCLCLSVFVCVFMCVSVSVCLCVCMHVYVSVCVSLYVGVFHGADVEVSGQFTNLGLSFSHLSCQAWQQVPSLTDPSPQPAGILFLFRKLPRCSI